jgi:ribosome-associated protein
LLRVTPTITIEESELEESFVRASGPGGQHVNKASTAVQLRFDAANCPALPEAVRRRLVRLAGSSLTREGVIVIDARRHRSQELNRRDARQRLVDLIRRAARQPKPRRRTVTPAGARERRLQEKKRRSEIKRRRKPPSGSA